MRSPTGEKKKQISYNVLRLYEVYDKNGVFGSKFRIVAVRRRREAAEENSDAVAAH